MDDALLDTEMVPIKTDGDVLVFQFRMRRPGDHYFTYQAEVSIQALVSENGYGSNGNAMMDDIRDEVGRQLLEGRFEDLVLRRHTSGWLPPEPAPEPLEKHSGDGRV